jgi:hypothetical protein
MLAHISRVLMARVLINIPRIPAIVLKLHSMELTVAKVIVNSY